MRWQHCDQSKSGNLVFKPTNPCVPCPKENLKSVLFKMKLKLKGEVAPAIYVSSNVKARSWNYGRRLETILEEGCSERKHEVVVPRRIFFFFPLLLSFLSYFLLFRQRYVSVAVAVAA